MYSICGSVWHYGTTPGAKAAAPADTPKGQAVRSYTALLSGESWVAPEGLKLTKSPVFITYSFPTKINDYDREADPDVVDTWHSFSKSDQKETRAALKQWGDACGIRFLEVKGSRGDIQFNWMHTGSMNSGVGYHPTVYAPNPEKPNYYTYFNEVGGDIYLNSSLEDIFKNDKSFKTYILLHEIGHAIGFKHTFDSYSINPKILAENYDNTGYSVMSYTYTEAPTKLGSFDIQAARALYGSPKMDGKLTPKWSWNSKAEILTQIGKAGADTLRGTRVKDIIKGAAGDDVLQGFVGSDTLHGGDGTDVLIGGPDHDTFVFDNALDGATNIDVIYDFMAKEDTIRLSQDIFQAVSSKGKLSTEAFVIASKAQDASDRIIYDDGYTGDLFYDPDGTGPTQQIKFAKLDLYTGLKANNFLIA
jgi:hypothetical protein